MSAARGRGKEAKPEQDQKQTAGSVSRRPPAASHLFLSKRPHPAAVLTSTATLIGVTAESPADGALLKSSPAELALTTSRGTGRAALTRESASEVVVPPPPAAPPSCRCALPGLEEGSRQGESVSEGNGIHACVRPLHPVP